MKLRLSPSGPVVENAEGGPLEFGTGAVLRLAEATTTVGGSLALTNVGQTIGTVLGGGTVMIASLLAPRADYRYRATVLVDVKSLAEVANAQCVLYLDTSADGLNWVERVVNAHEVGRSVDATEIISSNARQVRLDLPMALGSALGVTGSSSSLRVRARIRKTDNVAADSLLISSEVASAGTTPVTGLIGTGYLSLSEHF